MGGPFGAVVGAAFGHAADQGELSLKKLPFHLPRLQGAPGGGGAFSSRLAADLAALLGQKERYFSVASVMLAAKLAKCDGPVNRTEIDAVKRVFHIPPEAVGQVGRLFDAARQSPKGFAEVARQLAGQFHDQPGRLEDVLGALFVIARADKPLTVAEHAFLQDVHVAFGLDAAAWDRASGSRSRPSTDPLAAAPYRTLGLTPQANDEEVRAAWKHLVRENHPDTLAARGASAAEVTRASQRVARINAAWDEIKHARGL